MKTFYFIGIAGTAMGNLAIALSQRGFRVFGSDVGVYPPMSQLLDEHGIVYSQTFDKQHIIECAPDIVIIGNAISRGNPEVEYVLNQRIPYTSMSEIIHSEIIGRNSAIVITGTHGKTTTTSMTAFILDCAGKTPGFVIGAKPGNFDHGCRPIPEELFTQGTGICVIEGDEYDTAFWDKRSKFFHYPPSIAVINAIEFDHGDIFESIEDIKTAFRYFLRLLPGQGLLLINADDANAKEMIHHAYSNVETFGIESEAHWMAKNIRLIDGNTIFECWYNRSLLKNITLPMIGHHNVRNALAAIAACHHSGVSIEAISEGFPSFVPPKRRLEHLCIWKGRHIIDDFAHHPTAIKETVKALRKAYPDTQIHAVFEPRSNTTTRNIFQDELSECFIGVNSIVIGPINRPERFTDEERLDIDALIQAYQKHSVPVHPIRKDSPDWGNTAIEYLKEHSHKGDIIVLMSNGNIGNIRSLFQTT